MNSIKNDITDLFDVGVLEPEANYQLPSPELLQYYKDKKERSIFITKDIDESLFNEMRLILEWNREDEAAGIPAEERKKIKIYIHSYGGDLYSTMGFISVMNLSKTPIATYNLACAMSSGAIIFINGHRGLRYCLRNSTALLHSGSASQGGDYNAVVQQTEQYKKLIKRLHENILERTTIKKATLTKNLKTDWYIDDENQVACGLCEHIVDDISQMFG